MKKNIIIFTLLVSVLGFTGCSTRPEQELDNSPEIEASDTVSPTSSVTPEVEDESNTDDENIDSEYKDVTYEISSSLQADMPIYRFVAKGLIHNVEGSIGYVMGLDAYDEKGESLLSVDYSQMISDEVTGNPVYIEMMDTMGLHVVDINFDGYKDVIILNDFSGAHGNTWYDAWLWNSDTSSFIKSESFATIANPALDSEKKYIYSTGGSGASNQSWNIYQFIDNEFVVTNSLTYEATDKGYKLLEQKHVNGKMETVRDEVIQADKFDDMMSTAGYINDDLWKLDNPRWYGIGGHHADQWLED